jgi:hypothetical protein
VMLCESAIQRAQARIAATTLWSIAPLFRAALVDGIAARACRRLGLAPDALYRWP